MPLRADQPEQTGSAQPSAAAGPVMRVVEQAVERLRYGTVQLTIHDGRIVQLDVTERQRFP